MLTQKYLQEYIRYDQNSGLFFWIKRPTRSKIKIGDIAGSDDGDGYNRIQLSGKAYRSARLAWLYMTGNFPKELIDHINGIRSDDRFCNLREASYQQNCKNISMAKNNTLGIKGVFRSGNGWVARAMHNKKYFYLGIFKTIKEAGEAYKDFAKKVHKEFYRQ